MDSYVMVRPEHLNHQSRLFGGQLLYWIDEYAWIAARKEFKGISFVTRAMDKIEFKIGIIAGSILRFSVVCIHVGTSSVTYRVDVYADMPGSDQEVLAFTNTVTLVSIDQNGNKKPLFDKTGKNA